MDRHQGDVLHAVMRDGFSHVAGAPPHRLAEFGSVSSRAQLAARALAGEAMMLRWRIAQKRDDADVPDDGFIRWHLPKRTSRIDTPFGPMKRCGICGKLTKHPIHHPDNHPKRGR